MSSSNNLCSYARSRAKTHVLRREGLTSSNCGRVPYEFSSSMSLLVVTVVYIIALASASELSPGGPMIE